MDNMILATQQGGILGPFAWVLGKIIEVIYNLLDIIYKSLGIESRALIIGLSIIFLTIVVRMCLLPMQIKQQKYSKVNAYITPEVKAVQEKYKNKKDQASQLAQQEEIQAVYDKYGTSPTGSCLQLIIQMPILFALYRVFMNIPAYVAPVKTVYTNVINGLSSAQLKEFFDVTSTKGDNLNKCIDAMSSRTSKLDIQAVLDATTNTEAAAKLTDINQFFGLNLSLSPSQMHAAGMALIICLIIPVLSGLFQFASVQLSTKMNGAVMDSADNPMAGSMKTMNLIMPLFSVYMCYEFASGLGLYWCVSSLVMILQQVFINFNLRKFDVNEIIEKNKEKAEAKRIARNEKQGVYRDQVLKGASTNTKSISGKAGSANGKSFAEKERLIEEAKKRNMNSKSGSISSRVNMVNDFNEKNK